MAQFLAAHPEIFMARKEMHMFGRDLRFGPRFYRRDLENYLAEFSECRGQKRTGEASVWYLFSEQAASEIKAFNPDSRIIVMLRDPVEMLFSLYHEFRWDGNENLPSFEAALAAEPARLAGRLLTRRTYFAQGLVYRRVARFTEQIRRYFDAFGRARVHVVLYDDFAADPAAAYRNLLSFLELEADKNQPRFPVINGNKIVKSSLLRSLFGDQWLRSKAISFARHLPKPLFKALQNAEEKLWKLNTRSCKRSPLDPGLRRLLSEQLRPEIEQLGHLLGRDLSHWSNPAGDFLDHTHAKDALRERGLAPMVGSLQSVGKEQAAGLCPSA
jgi:hypothetical protein